MTVRSDFSENAKAITICKSWEEVGISYLYSVGRFTACCAINLLTETEFPVAQRKEYVVKFARFLETHGENSETEDIIEVNFETSSQIHRRRFNRRRNKDGEHDQQRKPVL